MQNKTVRDQWIEYLSNLLADWAGISENVDSAMSRKIIKDEARGDVIALLDWSEKLVRISK